MRLFRLEKMRTKLAVVNDPTYGGVKMPDVRVVHGSTMILLADWHVEGVLPDGRVLYLDVKAGFVFDGASIPRALWRVCGHPLEAPRIAAALAHDWLYSAHVCEREIADAVFREICRMVGIGSFRSGIEYGSLRLFGSFAWSGHGRADELFARAHGALSLRGEQKSGG